MSQVTSSQVKSCENKSRPSILKELDNAKKQVDYEFLGEWEKNENGEFKVYENGLRVKHTKKIYYEMCLIIAEVNTLSPDDILKVADTKVNAFIVQEVFSLLSGEHLKTIANNYEKITYPVKQKKPYLLTALYNSVFELEAGYINESSQIMSQLYEPKR